MPPSFDPQEPFRADPVVLPFAALANSAAAHQVPPLKVVLVVLPKKWGGGEEQARLLAHGLRERGHHCLAVGRAGGAFVERLGSEGFETVGLSGGRLSLGAYWQMRRKLSEFQPHVLHLNDPHALTLGGLAACGLSIPARIAARHTSIPIHWPRRYNVLVDRVVCVCQNVARIAAQCGVRSEQLRVVYPGVPAERFAAGNRERGRASLGLSAGDLLLLTVANLVQLKGHRFLLDALPAVLARYPRACLVLAGEGSERAALERQARGLGIESRVRFVGFRRDVPDLIRASDLFVMPTLVEGVCSVLVEAMLGGAPLVTTTVGGIPEVVGDANTPEGPVAWTVPPGNTPALAAAICEALGDSAGCARQGARGRQRACELFGVERLAKDTEAVYCEALLKSQFQRVRRAA